MRVMLPVLMLVAVFLVACTARDELPDDGSKEADNSLQVYAVNYPLAWAAEQLLDDGGVVHFPVPAGIDPAFWEPDLAAIGAFQQADVILVNGAGYARWLKRAALPANRLVDTSRSFADQLISLDSGPVHSHGP